MTLKNAYNILQEVRVGLNEGADAYVQGTDTTGAYTNADILTKINNAQRLLYNMVAQRDPQAFLKSTVLTGVNSVYTPPGDFFKMSRLEDQWGGTIHRIPLERHRRVGLSGKQHAYYWVGNTIVIDKISFTDPITLWYWSRVRDLTSGSAGTGAVKAITLDTTARKDANYYTGMLIEDVTSDWVDTITAYSTARVATIAAQTSVTADYYGLVSELPDALHHLIGPKALLLMKESVVSPEKPKPQEYKDYMELLSGAFMGLFGTNNSDVDIREVFY